MKIDKEFQALIPPLTDEEFKQLEENILAEGVRESLIVWDAPDGDRYIVDGHNRWNIIQKHNLQLKTLFNNANKNVLSKTAVRENIKRLIKNNYPGQEYFDGEGNYYVEKSVDEIIEEIRAVI